MTFDHFLLRAAEMKKVSPIEKAVSVEKNDSTGLFLFDNRDMETPLRENPSLLVSSAVPLYHVQVPYNRGT